MSLTAQNYRENPTHPATFTQNTKTLRKIQLDLDNKHAYQNNLISLKDYLYAQASNIDYIPYLDWR